MQPPRRERTASAQTQQQSVIVRYRDFVHRTAPAAVSLQHDDIERPALNSVARTLSIALALAVWFEADPAQARGTVDLQLVLAVDVSGSVDAREFELQMQGLAQAFRDQSIQAAIGRSGDLGVAVAVVQWSGGAEQTVAVDWTLVGDKADCEILAARIAATPRYFDGGDTSIGGAINFSRRQVQVSGFQGSRAVIDVSSDGGANQTIGKALTMRARDRAVGQGMTVNALAMLEEDPTLGRFYRDYVIGGAGSFVMVADSYADFAAAILEKLLREIGDRPIAGAEPMRPAKESLTAQGYLVDGPSTVDER
jgi:hypothetical protein